MISGVTNQPAGTQEWVSESFGAVWSEYVAAVAEHDKVLLQLRRLTGGRWPNYEQDSDGDLPWAQVRMLEDQERLAAQRRTQSIAALRNVRQSA